MEGPEACDRSAGGACRVSWDVEKLPPVPREEQIPNTSRATRMAIAWCQDMLADPVLRGPGTSDVDVRACVGGEDVHCP